MNEVKSVNRQLHLDHDAAVAIHLGAHSEKLTRWAQQLAGEYDPVRWGFPTYGSIVDPRTRALASDLLLSSLDGVHANLVHIALALRDYEQLIGPNGRTMPGPETTVEHRVESFAIDRHAADAFRAVGSALDCLVAAAILALGLPAAAHRAEGGWLLQNDRNLDSRGGERQRQSIDLFGATVAQQIGEPLGWLAWTLEMRNAVIHRRQFGLWLPHGRRRPGVPQLAIRTEKPLHYHLRTKPHLRRRPWIADMHALGESQDGKGLWMAEPGPVTLTHLLQKLIGLTDALCDVLHQSWGEIDEEWHWPTRKWDLQAREHGARSEAAGMFPGFEPDYKNPPITSARMSARDAKRAALGERLRRRADV